MQTNKTTCCVPAYYVLVSNPPQYRCVNCGKTWFCHEQAPVCYQSPLPELKELEAEFYKEFGHIAVVKNEMSGNQYKTFKSFLRKAYHLGGIAFGKEMGERMGNTPEFMNRYVYCPNCHTFGVPMPNDKICGNCNFNPTIPLNQAITTLKDLMEDWGKR